MAIGTQPAGRITIELFNDKTPETSENFRLLCTGEKGKITTPTGSHELCFKGSTFHRIISEFMIQGGDITNADGTGGASTFPGGKMFADENLGWRKIDSEGLVCMANRGKGTNSSQFFITLADCDYLTGKHTLFGHVVSGIDVVKKIEALSVDESDRPFDAVIVANCGELVFKKKEPAPTKNTLVEARRGQPRPHSRSRDRKKDDEGSHRHRRKHSKSRDKSDGKSRDKEPKDATKDTNDTQENEPEDPAVEGSRGRSLGSRGAGPMDTSIPEEPEDSVLSLPPKRAASRSRSRHRHRRRQHHSGSKSPERKRHRRGKSRSRSRRGHRERTHDYTRDEEAEERIKKEEDEREMGRFSRMEAEAGKSGDGAESKEPEVKFKGRGSMKYREKKSWGWGGGGGRLM
ncbi:hypothetical protein Q9L58_000666 [Maublancomyces gigas]|uniref:peptidylprolyl isomerase n=1 Tax=Discina gigas TaxID=1032678 RepID=A0ABR3GWR1_9PEZI